MSSKRYQRNLRTNSISLQVSFSISALANILQLTYIYFSLYEDLNLSHNQMAKLPDELADLNALARLNISHNSFIVLPPVVFKMPKLRELDASHNAIIGKSTI